MKNLNFKTFGSGPALVILHGLFGSLDNWQTLARRWADHFSVYIVDQRNHGKSPHSDAPFSYPAMAADLSRLMDSEGIYAANLMGHSMGGKTVMEFAAEWPERVEKLVVADMSPLPGRASHLGIFEALQGFPLLSLDSRQEAEAWLAQAIPETDIRLFLLKSLVRLRGNGFRWKFNLDVIARDYQLILAEIEPDYPVEVPTLFIRGGKSDYVPAEKEPEIRERFPGARFATVAGAGHWLHAERPDDFFNQVNAFLLSD